MRRIEVREKKQGKEGKSERNYEESVSKIHYDELYSFRYSKGSS